MTHKGMVHAPTDSVHTTTEANDPAWDAFVASAPGGHHVQTSLWAQVKQVMGWQAARATVSREGELVGGGQMLIRQVRRLGKVGYVPKGPVLRYEDDTLCKQIIHDLRTLGRQHHVRYLAIQPPDNGAYIASCLGELGFRTSWIELAPTATILIDVTQDLATLQGNLSSPVRGSIRRCKREGVTIREGSAADLGTFYRLHVATSKRQQFVPYPEQYFTTMWRLFEPGGHITMQIAEYRGEAISAMILIAFGTMALGKVFGWTGEHSDRRPNHGVWWNAIKWSKEHGYRCFDMEGIDPDSARALLNGGHLPTAAHETPDFLKIGFGGQVVLNPVAYDYVYNPVLRSAYRVVSSRRFAEIPTVSRIIDSLRQH